MNMYLQTNAQKKPSSQHNILLLLQTTGVPDSYQKQNTHACMHRHTQTLTLTHSLTLNNTATGGFRQEGLPRKRWEGTLAICVEHIFIWAETERHKNPRRAREVICPDSSFTLPRCNTDARTRTDTSTGKCARMNTYTHMRAHMHAQIHTEMPKPPPLPNTSREVNQSCHHRNVSREVVRLCVCAWMHKLVDAKWPYMCSVTCKSHS